MNRSPIFVVIFALTLETSCQAPAKSRLEEFNSATQKTHCTGFSPQLTYLFKDPKKLKKKEANPQQKIVFRQFCEDISGTIRINDLDELPITGSTGLSAAN